MRIFLRMITVFLSGLFVLVIIPKTLQLVSLKVHASGSVVEENYYLYKQNEDDTYDLTYTELYASKYSKKQFLFSQVHNALTLQIVQKNEPYGDLESIEAFGCNQRVLPTYAHYVQSGESVLEDIVEDDNNVIVVHDRVVEVHWDIPSWCDKDIAVYMKANSYGHGLPIVMPEKNFFQIRSVESIENISLDGIISEVEHKKADFEYLFQPSSGHPDGITYTYVREYGDYTYFAFDITADNTNEDSEDWIELELVDINGTSKRFRVDDEQDKYGTCGFGITDKVSYKHQTCEMLIPKKNDESSKMRVRYYGTASIFYTFQAVRGTDNSIYTRRKSESSGQWSSYAKSGLSLSKISMARKYIDVSTYVFQATRGIDNKVYTRYTTDGVTWSAWRGKGVTDGNVEMIATSVGTTAVTQAVRGTDNKPYHRYTSNGTSWTSWMQSSGQIKGNISLTEGNFAGVRLYEAVRGTDDKIYVRYTTNGTSWTSWKSLGGKTHEDVTIFVYSHSGDTDLVIAVRGTDNYVYTRFSEDGNTWNSWKRAGKTLGKVEMDSTWFSGEDRLYQAARGTNNKLYYRYSLDGDTWNGWTKVNKECYDNPGLYEEPAHHYVYFATRASDDTIFTEYVNNTDSWTNLPGVGKTIDQVSLQYY